MKKPYTKVFDDYNMAWLRILLCYEHDTNFAIAKLKAICYCKYKQKYILENMDISK
jgi:hypothetical protein